MFDFYFRNLNPLIFTALSLCQLSNMAWYCTRQRNNNLRNSKTVLYNWICSFFPPRETVIEFLAAILYKILLWGLHFLSYLKFFFFNHFIIHSSLEFFFKSRAFHCVTKIILWSKHQWHTWSFICWNKTTDALIKKVHFPSEQQWSGNCPISNYASKDHTRYRNILRAQCKIFLFKYIMLYFFIPFGNTVSVERCL